jgi:DNA primase
MREEVLSLLQRHLAGPFRQAGGSNVLTKCPFHGGGQERKPSFSVNLEKGVFQCFTCHEAGDIRLLLKKLGLPRVLVDNETQFIQPLLDRQRELHKLERANTFKNSDPFKADFVLPEQFLGVYEVCPTLLLEKGFNIRLLQDLEVGYDRFNQRITYPLRDMYGNLAGISGGATQPWQSPKYNVYQGGRRLEHGQWQVGDFGKWFDETYPGYRCENHDFLWNFDRVWPRLEALSASDATLYIVEGFKACMWMIQAGFQNTVALMGSYISDRQQKMIHRLGCTVVLCLDNDKAGLNASERIGDLLWQPMYGRVKVMKYPEGHQDTQPDSYPAEVLVPMVGASKPYMKKPRKPRDNS